MFAVSVCLSRGSSRLRCEKIAEQIKMLFGVNSSGGPWNIVLDVGPDPSQRGEGGPTFKISDFPHISGTAEATDLKFCVHI